MPAGSAPSVRPVIHWLLLGCVLIAAMVVIGGITRLTGSGLSITEWDPIMGAVPPLNEAEWQEAFAKAGVATERPLTTLLLGYGGGSAVHILQKG